MSATKKYKYRLISEWTEEFSKLYNPGSGLKLKK